MRTKLFFGMAAMALLASCESVFTEDVEVILGTEPSDMTFSAVIAGNASTRTALSDEADSDGCYSLYWAKGDAISISDGESTAIFTTESDGTSSGEFTRKEGRIDGDAYSYTAFYPSSITSSNMTLPARQNYVPDNVENFPMYARSYTKDLEFKNLCGIIRLSLKNEESGSIEVSGISLSTDNAGMSGSFTVGTDGAAEVDGEDGVQLTCAQPVTLYKNLETDFNIIVPKGSYNPLKVKISSADGKEANLVSEAAVNVNRSGITKITITLDSSSFDSSLEMIPITESDVEFTDR